MISVSESNVITCGSIRQFCIRLYSEVGSASSTTFVGGGGLAIEAEWVCRLVLPGVRTCSPLQRESSTRGWGLGGPPIKVRVMRAGRELGSLLGYLTAGNFHFYCVLCESGTVVPLLTTVTTACWRPSHAGAGILHKKSFPKVFFFW